MPARADLVNAEGDSVPGADDDGVEDGDVVGRGDEREVEDDGDQNMRSTEDADDDGVSAPPVDEVKPARTPINFSKWGCLGAISFERQNGSASQEASVFYEDESPRADGQARRSVRINQAHRDAVSTKAACPPEAPEQQLGFATVAGLSTRVLWCEFRHCTRR